MFSTGSPQRRSWAAHGNVNGRVLDSKKGAASFRQRPFRERLGERSLVRFPFLIRAEPRQRQSDNRPDH